jgi:HK97 family phage major capsid protein
MTNMTLTREIYTDWDAFSQYALAELQRQVIDCENGSLLAGDGTGTDMLGFYATPGIFTHDCSTDTGTDETTWDSIEKSFAALRSGPALAEPSLAVFHPDDWSTIRRIKDQYGRFLVAPDPSDDQVNECWGCPVLTTTQNPIGQGLLIDGSKFAGWPFGNRWRCSPATTRMTSFATSSPGSARLAWCCASSGPPPC